MCRSKFSQGVKKWQCQLSYVPRKWGHNLCKHRLTLQFTPPLAHSLLLWPLKAVSHLCFSNTHGLFSPFINVKTYMKHTLLKARHYLCLLQNQFRLVVIFWNHHIIWTLFIPQQKSDVQYEEYDIMGYSRRGCFLKSLLGISFVSIKCIYSTFQVSVMQQK